MGKGIRINRRILWIAAAAAVLLAAVGVCGMMFRTYVSIRGQHLNAYSYSEGGGMTGGYLRKTVKRYGEGALISIESAEWYAQDPTVSEYLADAAVLEELEAVVRRYRMNFWNRKTFTHMFVSDGETMSYHFGFDEADISFSSQIYPLRYGKKLAELGRVIETSIGTAEKLPGLVNPWIHDEAHSVVSEGERSIYVYSYIGNTLGVRILNGLDEELEIPGTYTLMNADTGAVLYEEETPYGGRFSAHAGDEMDLRLKERLPAGHYKLLFGDAEIPFEIR